MGPTGRREGPKDPGCDRVPDGWWDAKLRGGDEAPQPAWTGELVDMTEKIVVGVDGSAGSVKALRWAYQEAACRRASVEVVNVWHYPYTGGMAIYAIPEKEFELGAQQVMHRTLDDAGPSPEGVSVDTAIMRGGAASCLLDRARSATLLVVGSRGHGGFTGLLLGSVSQQCAHHAPCPVVIVPPDGEG